MKGSVLSKMGTVMHKVISKNYIYNTLTYDSPQIRIVISKIKKNKTQLKEPNLNIQINFENYKEPLCIP